MPNPTIRVRRVYNAATSRFREQGEAAWPEVVAQTTTVRKGDWLRVGVGCNLVLELHVSAISGTLDVDIETAASNEATPVTLRVMDSFATASTTGTQRLSFPGTDEFVRFVATPGVGGGQTASYTLAGTVVPVS